MFPFLFDLLVKFYFIELNYALAKIISFVIDVSIISIVIKLCNEM